MPAPRKQTQSSDAAFFAALERGATVVDAARLTGVTRQALYLRRICDPDFNMRWHSIELARRRPKGSANRRFRQPVFDPRGDGSSAYSDGRLLARLKAVRPQCYLRGRLNNDD